MKSTTGNKRKHTRKEKQAMVDILIKHIQESDQYLEEIINKISDKFEEKFNKYPYNLDLIPKGER